MNIVEIEVVDYSPEYGFFGKVIGRSDVRGMTAEERQAERDYWRAIAGDHVGFRDVEVVGDVAARVEFAVGGFRVNDVFIANEDVATAHEYAQRAIREHVAKESV